MPVDVCEFCDGDYDTEDEQACVLCGAPMCGKCAQTVNGETLCPACRGET